MSFDIYALVPSKTWPTARQLDDALVAEGWPARLGERPPHQWDAPLAPVVGEPSLFVVSEAEHSIALGVEVGSTIEMPNQRVMPVVVGGELRDPDFGFETINDPTEVNSNLGEFGSVRRAYEGDKLIWFSHHVDQWNYNAGMYVLATFIRHFDAYGFEFQGMSHGTDDFADELIGSLYSSPEENPFAPNS